jgi:DNA-binding NtrC family response regulator
MFQLRDSPSSLTLEKSSAAPPQLKELMGLGYQDAKQRTLERFTQAYIEHRLEEADYNITKAASLSEMQRPNFSKLMKKFGIDLDSLKKGSS